MPGAFRGPFPFSGGMGQAAGLQLFRFSKNRAKGRMGRGFLTGDIPAQPARRSGKRRPRVDSSVDEKKGEARSRITNLYKKDRTKYKIVFLGEKAATHPVRRSAVPSGSIQETGGKRCQIGRRGSGVPRPSSRWAAAFIPMSARNLREKKATRRSIIKLAHSS